MNSNDFSRLEMVAGKGPVFSVGIPDINHKVEQTTRSYLKQSSTRIHFPDFSGDRHGQENR
jgi:hypothetical protein